MNSGAITVATPVAKADEIDHRIKELKAMSNGLRHAAVCPAENHFECPTFQRLLRVAATGALASDTNIPRGRKAKNVKQKRPLRRGQRGKA